MSSDDHACVQFYPMKETNVHLPRKFPQGFEVLKVLLDFRTLSSHPDDPICSGNLEKLYRRVLPSGMHSLHHLENWLTAHSVTGYSLGLGS